MSSAVLGTNLGTLKEKCSLLEEEAAKSLKFVHRYLVYVVPVPPA